MRALKAGAAGYLTKQSASEELFKAVRKALRGERYITAALAAQLADTVSEKKRPGRMRASPIGNFRSCCCLPKASP